MSHTPLTKKLSIYILSSCILLFIILFGYTYYYSRNLLINTLKTTALATAQSVSYDIEASLVGVEKVPINFANYLESRPQTTQSVNNLLRMMVTENPDIFGAAIAFEPYSFYPKKRKYAPYYYTSGETVEYLDLGKSYDYFSSDWYADPKGLKQPMWSNPYFDEGGGDILMCTFSVPFYRMEKGEKTLWGILTADVSLEWLKNRLSDIELSKSGYAFLVSKSGQFIAHPNPDYVMKESIFSLAKYKGNAAIQSIGSDMIAGQTNFVNYQDGESWWQVYTPVATTSWSVGILYPQSEYFAEANLLGQVMVLIGAVGLFVLLVLIVFISRSITLPIRQLAEATQNIGQGDLDFKTPPVLPSTTEEVALLTESFSQMRGSLKAYIDELQVTTSEKQKVESELQISHQIQMSMVPKNFEGLTQTFPCDIFACLKPAKEVGGDFYDFFISNDLVYCVIGDVSGKGVPAALFMAVAKTLMKSLASHSRDPGEILSRVNDELCVDNDQMMFVTVFLLVWSPKTGEVNYASGGHNPPYHTREGVPSTPLTAKGLALGVMPDQVFETKSLILGKNEGIFLYTDGVNEAQNASGELFSDERLLAKVESYKAQGAQTCIESFMEVLTAFQGEAPQADDITMLFLKNSKSE